MFKRWMVAPVAAVLGVLAAAGPASAAVGTPADYGSLTEQIGSELGAAVPVALAAVGLTIGILVAYRVVRRIVRA